MAAIQGSLPATISNTAPQTEEEFGPRSIDKLEVSGTISIIVKLVAQIHSVYVIKSIFLFRSMESHLVISRNSKKQVITPSNRLHLSRRSSSLRSTVYPRSRPTSFWLKHQNMCPWAFPQQRNFMLRDPRSYS